MATGATARDGTVIEAGHGPVAGAMTVVAAIAAGDMGRRLAGGSASIVTGRAAAADCAVIHAHRGPAAGAVAGIAAAA